MAPADAARASADEAACSSQRIVGGPRGPRGRARRAELALTRIEFDLLAAFATHPRRVWTREALLRSVWQSEWAQDTHLVEVHVGNLRRSLGDEPWIRTVRGVGYRFNPLSVTVTA